jgi:hypothetical protein
MVRAEHAKIDTTAELLQATRSCTVCNIPNVDSRRANAIATRVKAYVDALSRDVDKRWFSEKSDSKSVARELVNEAAELMSEFTKEGRKTGVDKTKDISKELVDTLFMLVKYISTKEVDIAREWRKFIDSSSKASDDFHVRHFKDAIDKMSADNVSDIILFCAFNIYSSEVENDKEFFFDGTTAYLVVGQALYNIFKVAEERGINLESTWKQKMEENDAKHASEYGLLR